MRTIIKNWKTTVLGLVAIVLTLLKSSGKLDAGTAAGISAGVGLIIASDGKPEQE